MHLLDPENNVLKDRLNKMQSFFVDLQKPQIFDPTNPDNILRKTEEMFEETVNTMEDQGHFDPKNLSEYSFYHKMIFLQKKFSTKTGET